MKNLIFVCIILLTACKKEKNNTCYKCQVIENGVAHEEKMCGNADGIYKDAQGNDLQCEEIH
jgi:hypothetical protein